MASLKYSNFFETLEVGIHLLAFFSNKLDKKINMYRRLVNKKIPIYDWDFLEPQFFKNSFGNFKSPWGGVYSGNFNTSVFRIFLPDTGVLLIFN